jgi:hypothetical protein
MHQGLMSGALIAPSLQQILAEHTEGAVEAVVEERGRACRQARDVVQIRVLIRAHAVPGIDAIAGHGQAGERDETCQRGRELIARAAQGQVGHEAAVVRENRGRAGARGQGHRGPDAACAPAVLIGPGARKLNGNLCQVREETALSAAL